jgi:hypothetical protein
MHRVDALTGATPMRPIEFRRRCAHASVKFNASHVRAMEPALLAMN